MASSRIKKYWCDYEVVGLLGCALRRRERGVKFGEVRFIAGELMYAYQIYSGTLFTAPEISWSFVRDVGMEEMRKWEASL